eukprot:765063-Hanusia_phi.AAC.3
MSLVCHFIRKVANKDVLWKALYLERWADPKSHIFARDALREGWKKVYASKDMDIKAQAGLLGSGVPGPIRGERAKSDSTQDAFRAMQAAKRSLSLNKKAAPKPDGSQLSVPGDYPRSLCCPSYDGLARGCELSLPNDDGYFVCPITGEQQELVLALLKCISRNYLVQLQATGDCPWGGGECLAEDLRVAGRGGGGG